MNPSDRTTSHSDSAASPSSPQRGEVGRGVRETWRPPTVPPSLIQAARDLRHDLTDAERRLWRCLRGKQLDGCRFRRQHPLDRFVLDFYCPAASLALEIDGGQHNAPPGQKYDAERTRCLQAHGIRVLRFWNHEVLHNLPEVLERIRQALHRPPSCLPPLGGGAQQESGKPAEPHLPLPAGGGCSISTTAHQTGERDHGSTQSA